MDGQIEDVDDEFSLDPQAFAEDAQPLDLNNPKVAAEFRAHLIESASIVAEKWRKIRARSWELAHQIFIG